MLGVWLLDENSISSTQLYKEVWTPVYFVVKTTTPSSFFFLRSALRFDDTSSSIVWKCLDDHSHSSLPRTPLIYNKHIYVIEALLHKVSVLQFLFCSSIFHFRNLLPISHVCTEDGEKPMVLLPFMAWGNLKLFLRQCKLAEANNPQVRRHLGPHLVELWALSLLLIMKINGSVQVVGWIHFLGVELERRFCGSAASSNCCLHGWVTVDTGMTLVLQAKIFFTM